MRRWQRRRGCPGLAALTLSHPTLLPADGLVGKVAIPAYALSDDDCSSGYQRLSVESDPEEGGEPGPAALPCRRCGLPPAASLGQSCLQCAGGEGGRSQRIVYSCQLCPFASHYSSHLKRHMKTHNGEKPFACPQCAYASAQLVNLTRHLRTHTGEKPYRCTGCSFACSSLGNLKRHERVHSQDKPFQCAACDYRCNQSRNLKRHMLSHRLPEGEGPHRDKDPGKGACGVDAVGEPLGQGKGQGGRPTISLCPARHPVPPASTTRVLPPPAGPLAELSPASAVLLTPCCVCLTHAPLLLSVPLAPRCVCPAHTLLCLSVPQSRCCRS